ncbi:unnamed protein product [Didymodactylos carnosus]|uniref:EGF-like domain-containing protein n=1 Tax=Didymodactylos carnosus TaxID=1234261 RepID=A0A815FN95_9BILA|nr:unnamed protein product [Didymodactylos carnosus]CAF4180263.1 unnamed protein product [Didymodactylos carnosus]
MKNSTHQQNEYTDRLGNKFQSLTIETDNLIIEEHLLPYDLKETSSYDLNDNQLTIETRNKDKLKVKYDENLQRIFYSHATGDKKRECFYTYDSQNIMDSAFSTDSYDSVFNFYDSLGRLVKTKKKTNLEIEYIYNSKSNIIEINSNDNNNMKYVRDKNENIKEIRYNNDIIAIVNHSISGYQIYLTKVFRNYKYIYSEESGLLSKYIIEDLRVPNNSITYEYEYNHKSLMTQMRQITRKDNDIVTKYSYDSLSRLVSLTNNKTKTVITIEYDLNGNRRRFFKMDEMKKESFEYSVNELNQYLTNGESSYTYDNNGNVVKEYNKNRNSEIFYNYYEDGKLLQFIDKDDNCTLKYDCLERLSQINCTNAGLFIFNYHSNSMLQKPLSVILPNKTLIYFIQFPLIGIIGFIIESKINFIELNGNLMASQILNSNGTIEPPISITNPDPFTSILSNLTINLNTFWPNLNYGTTLSTDNKPFSDKNEIVLGQPVYNLDGIFTSPYFPRDPINKNQPSQFNIKSSQLIIPIPTIPGYLTPPDMNSAQKQINRAVNRFNKPSTLSSICDKYNSFANKKKRNVKQSRVLLEQIRSRNNLMKMNFTKPRIIDDLCKGAAAFVKEYYFNDGTLASASNEFLSQMSDSYSNLNSYVDSSCNNVPASERLSSYLAGKAAGKITDKAQKALGKWVSPIVAKHPLVACGKGIAEHFFEDAINKALNWFLSQDPNDISGPNGYGFQNYISLNQKFKFIIQFENMENTTAPAQIVKITSILNKNYNQQTLMFTRYGFNDLEKQIIDLKKPYMNDLQVLNDYDVRVFATFNPISREILWTFKTIDKNTGDTPEDASIGFLPPTDGKMLGKGFIEFEVLINPETIHLTEIEANATIIFDNNEPIDTNSLTYTLDSVVPDITLLHIKNDTIQYLFINASDNGSGIKKIDLYDGIDNLIYSTNESIVIIDIPERFEPYNLYVSVEDNVLNFLPLTFYQNITVRTMETTECPNNCSENGDCTKYGVCDCFYMYKGDDCSMNVTLEDILNEPPSLTIGYYPSEIRNNYDLILETSESNETYVQIKNLPDKIQIAYNNEIILADSITYLSKVNKFTMKIPLNYFTNFNLDLNITTKRFNNITLKENYVSMMFSYPIYVGSFEPEYKFDFTVNCHNFQSNTNKILFNSTQLFDQDEIYVKKIQIPSFIEFDLNKMSTGIYYLQMNSSEIFDEIAIHLEFIVNNESKNSVEQIITYKICKETAPKNKPKSLSAGIISAIVISGVAFLLILVLIFTKTGLPFIQPIAVLVDYPQADHEYQE